ncbi:aconitase X swivel domain-containing protein [Ramlibacter sp.]|uniref:aconitase X swivel domain-containing protein n=1 Tax=Ramlibacter sp. TaxID=1917967 RepID=UPI002FCC79BE
MSEIICGRRIYPGVVEGEALLMEDCLGGYGAFNVRTGEIIEASPNKGQSVAGKVVFFRRAKGSSSWSIWHQALKFTGSAPAAYVVQESNTQVALGAVVLRIPAVELGRATAAKVATGDWVRVNGDEGTVEIIGAGNRVTQAAPGAAQPSRDPASHPTER